MSVGASDGEQTWLMAKGGWSPGAVANNNTDECWVL